MMNRNLWTSVLFALALAGPSSAAVLSGGVATIVFDEGVANSIAEFDALFSGAASRAQVLADPAPGNASFIESPADPSAGTITLTDPVRPFGEAPLNDAGTTTPGVPGASRTRQATTLDFDPTDVLGTWDVSNDTFGFTGNTLLGEQVALTGMTRWTGPFTGVLVYGDFALRYTGSRLVLTSNIDFLHAEFAEIGNPVVTVENDTLTISGDLLIDQALFLLDQTAVLGTDFGDFTLIATIVPEPASLALVGAGGMCLIRRRRR